MASEVKKLCETDTKGNAVTEYGKMDDAAMQQTLDLAKKYIKLSDSAANEKMQSMTLDDIRDASYLTGELGTPEKKDVSIQANGCRRHSSWDIMLQRQKDTMMRSG